MSATPPVGHGERRLDFSIAGTQKSATSTLSAVLTRHARIQRAPRKELHWFDNERRDWTSGDYSDLVLPPPPEGKERLIGDATPLYLWWPQAMERMHAYNPDLKVIGIFRDPIERLFSQWVMVVSRWPKNASDWPRFITQFAPEGLEAVRPDVNVHTYRMRSGVVRGYYGAQLERALSLFGPDQVRVLEFRAFLADHVPAINELADYLGIHPYRKPPLKLPHSMRGKEQVVGTAPTAASIDSLVDRYRDDFATFKRLSSLDVSAWPLQRIIDGSMTTQELADKYAAKVVAPDADNASPSGIDPTEAPEGPEGEDTDDAGDAEFDD